MLLWEAGCGKLSLCVPSCHRVIRKRPSEGDWKRNCVKPGRPNWPWQIKSNAPASKRRFAPRQTAGRAKSVGAVFHRGSVGRLCCILLVFCPRRRLTECPITTRIKIAGSMSPPANRKLNSQALTLHLVDQSGFLPGVEDGLPEPLDGVLPGVAVGVLPEPGAGVWPAS